MHDTLLANHLALGNGHLVEYASGLGLDISGFLRDMTAGVSRERVCLDRMSGVQSGVQDTPTFFVNGLHRHGLWEGNTLVKGSTSWGEGFRLEVSLLSNSVIRAEDTHADGPLEESNVS